MDSISKSIVSGTLYTAIAKYSNIVIQLIVTAILARFIAPEDFGIIAISSVFINLFYLLGDLGIGTAIIQRKDIVKDDLDEYFTFSFYLGVFLSLTFIILSPLISKFYESEVLRIILVLLSGQIFFSTLNMVPNALLLKQQEFKFIANRTIIVQFILGICSCVAAILGAGIYALLINPILGALLIFILNFIHVDKLRFVKTIHRASISKIFSYSVFQFMFSLQNYIYRNVDKLLIGKYLNMEQLGYYEKSYRLMLMPIQNISTVVTPVLQPVLSNYQHDIVTQQSYFVKVTKLLAVTGIPLSVFLFFTARELILIVFGSNWVDAILPFQILALSVTPQMLGSVLGAIYQTTNNVEAQLYIGLVNTVWSVSMMLFGLIYFGTTSGVAMMFTIALLVEMIYNWTFVYIYIYKDSVIHFFNLITKPIIIAFILGLILFGLGQIVDEWNIVLSFIVKTIVSVAVVGVLLQMFNVYDVKTLLLIGTTKIKFIWRRKIS